MTDELSDVRILARTDKIAAIKMLREKWPHLSLTEAKRIVDEPEAGVPDRIPHAAGTRRPGVVVAGVIGLIILLWLAWSLWR